MEWWRPLGPVLRENDGNGAHNDPSVRTIERAGGTPLRAVPHAAFVFEVEPRNASYAMAAILSAFGPNAEADRIRANARARAASRDQLMQRLDRCKGHVLALTVCLPSGMHYLGDEALGEKMKSVLNLASQSVSLTYVADEIAVVAAFYESDLEWLGKVAVHVGGSGVRTISFDVVRTGLLKRKLPPREPFMGWKVDYSNTHRVGRKDVSTVTLSAASSAPGELVVSGQVLRKSPRLSPA